MPVYSLNEENAATIQKAVVNMDFPWTK